MSNKVSVIDSIDRIKKNIKKISPGGIQFVAPTVKVKHFQAKNGFEFKFRPYNILEVAEKCMQLGPNFLSPAKKRVLVDAFGTDPTVWPTHWDELDLAVGMGGGKNVIGEVISIYTCQYWSNVVDPYAVLRHYTGNDVKRTTNLEITNNSMVGQEQAKTVFFDRLKLALQTTIDPESGDNLFARYIGLDLRDEGLGDIKAKVIEFPSFTKHSGKIKLHSLDSGVSTFEGKEIIVSFLDEPSRAASQVAFQNAWKLYQGLTGNTTTRFPMVGKVIPFSYYNTSEYDLMHKLVQDEEEEKKKAQLRGEEYKSRKLVYVFSTFEFNPGIKRDNPKVIKAYSQDEFDAKARYECIKSKSKYAFMQPHIDKIKECVITNLPNKINYLSYENEKKMKDGTIDKFTALQITDAVPDKRYRVWACDSSINKDRFCLGSAYNEEIERNIGTALGEKAPLQTQYRTVIDVMMVWSPNKERPVDYDNVGKVTEKLLEYYPNSVLFGGDKYQTESLAAIFRERGIKSDTFVFSNKLQLEYYTLLRTDIFNRTIGFCNSEINGETKLLVEELERVQKINQNKIDHPAGFSKDLSDLAAILNRLAKQLQKGQWNVATLDEYEDVKIIDLVDRLVKLENECRKQNISNSQDYICEMMNLDDENYYKLQNLKSIYFPNPI